MLSGGRSIATDKIVTLLRFAVRTRRIVAGPTGARVQAERRRYGIVLLASDLDTEKASAICRWAGQIPVPVAAPLPAEILGSIMDRHRCDVVFVYDKALSRSIGNALGV